MGAQDGHLDFHTASELCTYVHALYQQVYSGRRKMLHSKTIYISRFNWTYICGIHVFAHPLAFSQSIHTYIQVHFSKRAYVHIRTARTYIHSYIMLHSSLSHFTVIYVMLMWYAGRDKRFVAKKLCLLRQT